METIAIVAERRMSYFVAGVTNHDPRVRAPKYKRYRHVQYKKKVPVSATVSVSFPPSHKKYRYVVIQKKFAHVDAICLGEVKVFLRGIQYTMCMLTTGWPQKTKLSHFVHIFVKY